MREQHSPVKTGHVRMQASPVGLKNFGNTCFLNAVIQCLAVADGRDWEAVARKGIGTPVRTATIWEEYLRLVVDMKRGRRSYLIPHALRNAIERTHPSFDCSVQQDAHELMVMLFNSMGTEAQAWGSGGWEMSCLGQLTSTLICNECKETSTRTDDSGVVSLEIPDGKPSVSVMDCWKSFFSEERLLSEDGWTCTRCLGGSFATKQLRMTTEPPLLIIHLKRFKTTSSGRSYKCSDPVVIPLKLPLSSQYSLYGMVRHHGTSVASGHYTAEVAGGGGSRWWRCNDRSVYKTVRECDRESRDAYILFYKRHRQEDSTGGS